METDLSFLVQLYLACVDAVLAAISTFVATQDMKMCQKAAVQALVEHTKRANSKHMQSVITTRKHIQFSLQAFDSHNRPVSSKHSDGHLLTLGLSLIDLPSLEHPGANLGSVSFSETFMQSLLYVKNPDGAISLDTDSVILTDNVPRLITWPAQGSDASVMHSVQQGVEDADFSGFHDRLLDAAECHLVAPDAAEYVKRGQATFYTDGVIYVHRHLGPVFLHKSHMTHLIFCDGDSPSIVGLVIMTLKPEMQGRLPTILRSPTNQVSLALFPKTRAYKEFFSQVMHSWRGEDQSPSMELITDLPDCWMDVHAVLQQEYEAVAKPSFTPLKRAVAHIPHLHSYLDHFSASSCLQVQPVCARDLTAVLNQPTDQGQFPLEQQLILTIVTGPVGSHQQHMCETLMRVANNPQRWRLISPSLSSSEVFNVDDLVRDLMPLFAEGHQHQRAIVVIPGYTDTIHVIQSILNHTQLAKKVTIGAVTVCLDPLNVYMSEHYMLPALLDQCARGWVNNIVVTNGISNQTGPLADVQSMIRVVNSDVAFLLAEKGEVTRTPDIDLILSDTAFEESALLRARHLSCPGWMSTPYPTEVPPEMGSLTVSFQRPLDKTRLMSKLKGLRNTHKEFPFSGNVYAVKGTVSLADISRLHELHYTVLSSYISLTPTAVPSSPVVQNGSVSAPYFLVFTGCELQESALKAWLTECAQQVLEKKVLRTKKTITKTELKKIHSEHHLEPLPEGWFYNGSQYVSLEGEKSVMHPSLDKFVDEYLTLQNQEVQEHNVRVDQQGTTAMFEE